MLSARTLRIVATTCFVLLGVACTLITEVDRTKIPAEDAGGEAPSESTEE